MVYDQNRISLHKEYIDVPPLKEGPSEPLKIVVNRLTPLEMCFDLIHVDASLANAFRRTMIAEVPTIAFERVYMKNNTSIIPDEVLAHRIGLVPIKCHPKWMSWCKDVKNDSECTDTDTLVFNLKIKCDYKRVPKGKGKAAKDTEEKDPSELYENHIVYSHHFKWEPMGNQEKNFMDLAQGKREFSEYWSKLEKEHYETYGNTMEGIERDIIHTLYDDIILAKLRPGQEIDFDVHAVKGIGREHAKWSPVSQASYRLLPEIHLKENIYDKDAEMFQKCFPEGVIEIEMENGKKKAVVKDARNDTVSRECLRYDEFKNKVALKRVRDHFIFNIESMGQYDSPVEIFLESCKVLTQKCIDVRESLDRLEKKLTGKDKK